MDLFYDISKQKIYIKIFLFVTFFMHICVRVSLAPMCTLARQISSDSSYFLYKSHMNTKKIPEVEYLLLLSCVQCTSAREGGHSTDHSHFLHIINLILTAKSLSLWGPQTGVGGYTDYVSICE